VYLYKAYLTGKLSKSFVDENWDQPFLVDVETVQKLLAGELSTARIAAGPCSGQMMEWENLEEYEVPEPHGGGGLDSARSLYLDCALGAMRAADAVLGQKKEQECQRLAEAELAEKRLEELGKQLEECKGQVVELRRQLAVASAQTVQASEVRDGLCRTISYANGNDEVLSRIRDLLVEREAERLISEPNFTANDARELLAALSALQAEDEPALPGGLPLPAVATTPFRPAYGGPAVTNSHLHRPARKRRRRGGVDEGEIAAGLSAFERRLAAGLAPGEESAFFPEPSGHDSNSSDGGSRVLPCKRVASPPSSGMRAAEASSVYPNVNVDLASTPLPSDGTRTEMSSAPTQLDEGSGSRSRALQELIAEAATNPQAGRRQRFRTAPHNMALTYAFPKHTGGSSY
jgi:ribosomal protein L29